MTENDKARAAREAEQRAAVAEAARLQNEARGYETFLYHGVTMYRILDSPANTYSIERDAIEHVGKMRVAANTGP